MEVTIARLNIDTFPANIPFNIPTIQLNAYPNLGSRQATVSNAVDQGHLLA
ncbi:predicted protein [Botrytis cinerea T4]|uniref:Uncharacterized protein n=1 Tax=Botryotinia fuckeliana (strain T4) TaxID=999810 RepID=G2Y7T5_BOTF4|nr:predicted protein [Botrytis cinerea T4]